MIIFQLKFHAETSWFHPGQADWLLFRLPQQVKIQSKIVEDDADQRFSQSHKNYFQLLTKKILGRTCFMQSSDSNLSIWLINANTNGTTRIEYVVLEKLIFK